MSKRKTDDVINIINAIGQPEQKRAFVNALDRGDRDEAYRIYKEAITELEDLPDPILAKILFLTSVRDLHYLKRVDQRFRDVINEYELIRRRENIKSQLYGFGAGGYGTLGDGITRHHAMVIPTLVDIDGQSIKEVSAGYEHTMVVTENGQLYGFGNGESGVLGDGRADQHFVGRPILIDMNGQPVKQVSAAYSLTMVVTKNAQLYGFGNGKDGRIGDGRIDGHAIIMPTLIDIDGQPIKQVSVGNQHTMVVTENGQLYGFGNGRLGKLGNGRTDEHNIGTPTLVDVNGQSVKEVSAGEYHTMVVTENGQLYAFGGGNYGTLGDGRTDDHRVGSPILINVNGQSVKQVSAGHSYTMVITENGQLYAFGSGRHGKLGNGRTDQHFVGTPILIDIGGQFVKQVSAAINHTMVVTENGQLYTFGNGYYGRLGNGRRDDHNIGTPTLVNIEEQTVKQVSTKNAHAMVVTNPIYYNDLSVYNRQIAAQISDCQHCQMKLTDQQCEKCKMPLCTKCFDQLHL